MPQQPRVTVLGSLNTDISLVVPHLPGPGETVLSAAAADVGLGGKGANQAVAAARLGASVRMVGCCGDDEFGARLRAGLAREGVDASGVRTVPGATSGLALITVDEAGENSIAVAAGANGRAGRAEVAAAFAAPCDMLVACAEIPVGVLAAALARARAAGLTSVLNLAPVPAGAQVLLAEADWLVVNAQEAGVLLGRALAGPADAQQAAVSLLSGDGPRQVAVTLGPGGAVVAGPAGVAEVPGFPVRSVDAVGAGDAFVAALACALAAGVDAVAAVRAACAAGAAATTRRGAQAALPGPAEIAATTGVGWPPWC